MGERVAHPARPLQYRAGRSPLHRMGALWKLALATAIGAAALAIDALPWLSLLGVGLCGGYALAGLPAVALWKDLRWPLLQAVILVTLTALLRGAEGLVSGTRSALQLLILFLPFALVLRTTHSEALLELLRGRLPGRLAFALGATLRLLPVFARELAELVEMQRLRGARLRLRGGWHPGAWRDALTCVAFPMTVRAVAVAEEAAEAAEMRGIGTMRPARAGAEQEA